MAARDGSKELFVKETKLLERNAPSTNDAPIASAKAIESNIDTSTDVKLDENGRSDGEAKEDEEDDDEEDDDEEDDDEDEDDEDEEPRLKYATLTKNLGSLYKNGDATSACLVAGDKMVVGTHNGNIHVFSMPSLRTLRTWRGHQASITAVSISPLISSHAIGSLSSAPRLATILAEDAGQSPQNSPSSKRSPRQTHLPRTASNDIYIATASLDGHVCIQSLVDPSDTQLRSFGRPLQTVALSPEYKSDKTYLSGGQAGSLVLTVGGQKGKSTVATIAGAPTTTSSWLGSIGLGTSTGTDKIIHSGEGIITTIKWSPSGKYVIWANEQGIKIMRSNLHLLATESDLEWKRISHINRPEAEEAVGVWKARIEWIDRRVLDSDAVSTNEVLQTTNGSSLSTSQLDDTRTFEEEAVVGWGDQIWLIKVKHARARAKKNADPAGTAEITANLKLGDCVISGVSLYTQDILIVLAYMEKKGQDKSKSSNDEPRRGRMQRRTGLKPELRLIDMNTKEELESDMLPVSRYESLTSSDYHLAILPPVKTAAQISQRAYQSSISLASGPAGPGVNTSAESTGQGMPDTTTYGPRKIGVNRLFGSSGDSIRSSQVGHEPTPSIRERSYLTGWIPGFGSSVVSKDDEQLSAIAVSQGMKIFIYSPYDTVVAIKRNLADKLQWMIDTSKFQQAWELLDEHPEAAGTSTESPVVSSPPTPSRTSSTAKSGSVMSHPPVHVPVQLQNTLADFFADSESITSGMPRTKDKYSSAEKEKRRVGELWLQQLISNQHWVEAGEVAEKVLNTTTRWDYWVFKFIRNKKFDEIAFHVPTFQITPPLPSHVFEMILGHYVHKDRRKFRELLEQWPSDLFDIGSITTVITDQIKADNIRKDSEDWCLLQECLAKLYLADGHYTEALKCYIALQDADTAMTLMKEHHLVDAIADDIPGFVLLRIPKSELTKPSTEELEDLSSDSIKILVDEAAHGVVEIDDVVSQLRSASLNIFLFFYLRMLWQGGNAEQKNAISNKARTASTTLASAEGKNLIEPYADVAVELFAEYDRKLLMQFLHISTSYAYEKALKICEQHKYIEEQVYLLSKTGAMKKALFLIIDELQDVSKAITFAKTQDDPGLWNDFLEYSMSRPKFISGLLAEVGTAIDPIVLIKKIPSGLEIEGLKDGLMNMLREYDIQDSISSGAARVLNSEVVVGMDILRGGRRQGIKFDVPKHKRPKPKKVLSNSEKAEDFKEDEIKEISHGHCAGCQQAFTPLESDTLIGFACGHVYHLPHLFHNPGEGEGERELTLPKLTKDDDEGDLQVDFTKTIGPKVTNARLLKDKVEAIGGCKVCKRKHDEVPDT